MAFLNSLWQAALASTVLLGAAGYIFNLVVSRHIRRETERLKVALQVEAKRQEQGFQHALTRELEVFKQQLQLDSKTRELMLKSQIEYRERQLGELYGPIYARLLQWKPIWDLEAKGKLKEIEVETLKMYVTSNETIVQILLSKAHLVEGDHVPASSIAFLTHVALWHSFMKTKHGGVPQTKEELPQAYYPEKFEEEIVRTTERLKRELHELHRRYGLLFAESSASYV